MLPPEHLNLPGPLGTLVCAPAPGTILVILQGCQALGGARLGLRVLSPEPEAGR